MAFLTLESVINLISLDPHFLSQMRALAKNLSSSVTLQVHGIKINLVREMTKTNIHIVSIVGAVSLTEWIICFDIINHLCFLKLTFFVVKYNYKI